MFKNYLRVAFRNLRHNKGYTFINIAGLAVGVACCLLIVLYVSDELGYDRYHDNADRIARLVRASSALSAGPMGPALAADLSGVTRAARLDYEDDIPLRTESGEQFSERVFFADSTVFDIFTFTFLQGDPASALSRPDGLVMTETAARRFFGPTDALGQTLTAEADGEPVPFIVTGIIQDVPRQSHFHFDLMASFQFIEAQSNRMDNWATNWLYTYLLLEPGTTAGDIEAQLPAFFERHTGEAWDHFRIQALLDIHLHTQVSYEIEPQGSITFVYTFSAIALLVLLIACINFMNLTTARSTRRAREVGMRKVLGAVRGQLIGQFIGEAVLTALAAVLLAIGIAALCMPVFNDLAGKELGLGTILTGTFGIELIGATILLGLLAGSYPAFVLSSFKPIRILKGGGMRQVGSGRLRKTLVVFQFAVSCILMAGTLVVMQQLDFMKETNLGFDREQVVVLDFDDADLETRYNLVKAELSQHPNVVDVASGGNVPGQGVSDFIYRPEGLDGELGDLPGWDTYFVDGDYTDMFGMEIIQGRTFETGRIEDENAFLLNESAVAEMQTRLGDAWAEPVGKQLDFYVPGQSGWEVLKSGTVIGIVKDFHYRTLHETIGPLVLQLTPQAFDHVFVKISTADVSGTLAFLEEQHRALAPERSFDYFFLDSFYDSLYRAEERVQQLFGIFALLAVIIACLGLYGMAAFMAEQRTKEIGVRKVFGGTVPGMVALLAKDFVRLVLVASVVAVPIAYYGMNRWLENFAYHIDPGAGVFLLVAGLALVVALLTVSYQAIRAATANPVDSLRYE